MSDEIDLARHGVSGAGGAGLVMAIQMLWQRVAKNEEATVKTKLDALEKGQREISEKLAILLDREERVGEDRRELAQLRMDRETISVRLATIEAKLSVPPPRESRPH